MGKFKVLVGLATLVLLSAGCAGNGDEPAVDAPTEVVTSSGTLHGKTAGGVRQFDGVRYAQPPTGERRWALPQPLPKSDAAADATRNGAPCPQTPPLPGSAPPAEDCLFLNVTTPRRQAPNAALPVMVWWHGGGYTNDSGSLYDPQQMADKGNVIVVTVNYRLGIFGYFGLPGLAGSGDFGFADQIASLQWVHDNATAFGGDADNVTVVGQSAGGMSTCALLTSPSARGLVNKAIVMSGSCMLDWPTGGLFPSAPATPPYVDLATNRSNGEAASDKKGCTGPSRLACMRAKPVDQLLDVTGDFADNLAYGTDMLPTNPAVAVRKGDFDTIPVMSGGTAAEARSFVAGALLYDPNTVTAQTYPALLGAAFGDKAASVGQQYPLSAYPSPGMAWSTVVTDSAWACPTLRGNKALATKTPVHAYEFAQNDTIDVNGVAAAGLPQGPAHASDLPFLFHLGGADLLKTPAQHALSDEMIGYWTSFAKTGDPHTDGATPWDRFDANSSTVRRLADSGDRTVDVAAEHRCGFWDSVR